MSILGFWYRRRDARIAAKRAQELVERSGAVVLDRVRRRAATMRIAEARGFIRARSLEIVHRELAILLKGHPPLAPALQTQIVSQATNELTVRVLAELRSVPRSAPRVVEHRRAA